MKRRTFIKGLLGGVAALVTGVSVPVIAKEVSREPEMYGNFAGEPLIGDGFTPIWNDKLLNQLYDNHYLACTVNEDKPIKHHTPRSI